MALPAADFNLLRAAYSGDRNAVTAALNLAVDKNCRENTGYRLRAVQRAALSNESVVDLFVNDAGVQLNLTDDLGRTLLHLSWRSSVQTLEGSQRMGAADWNLRDNIHQTPLLCHARFVNQYIVNDLLRVRLGNGGPAVDITKTTIDGFTALHQVVEQDPLAFPRWYSFRPPADRCALVQSLLTDRSTRARLRLQAEQPGQPPTVAQLEGDVLELVNATDLLDRSALHYIAEDGCVEILDRLWGWFTNSRKRSQIHLEGRDFHGFAPLHLAVRRGHSHMVRRILEIPGINSNVLASVKATHPPRLQIYQENHKELCRPNLFSRKPSEEYAGKEFTPLQFAAMSGHTEIAHLLLDDAATNVYMGVRPSALDYSIENRHFHVAAKLLLDPQKRTTSAMDLNDTWQIFDTVLCLAEGPDGKTTAIELLTKLQQLTTGNLPVQPFTDFDGRSIERLITVAAKQNRHEIIRHILKWNPEVNANFKSEWNDNRGLQATPLHFAVLKEHVDAVRELLTHLPLDANTEDSRFRTPFEIAKTQIADPNTRREIERLLMGRPEVKELVDRLYRDRQVFVDAANALLVGAALIASVTFAGWLQPPLGYTPYYEYPESLPAPPSTSKSYAAVKQNANVQAFWFFNSLSFFFAMATVLTGAIAAMPSLENAFIGTVVKSVKRTLIYASVLLAISVVCVLCAFASAGFAVLPPTTKYNWSMISTVAIGALVCLICLAFFLWRLSEPIRLRLHSFRSNLRGFPWPRVGVQKLQLGDAQV